MYTLQVLIIDMSIDLRSRDRGVTQESLYCSDICTLFDQSSGKTMSEDMWRDSGGNSGQ